MLRKVFATGIVIMAGLILIACSDGDETPPSTPRPTSRPTTPPSYGLDDVAVVCDGRAFRQAAPYEETSEEVRPVVYVARDEADLLMQREIISPLWFDMPAAWEPDRYEEGQLVVCIDVAEREQREVCEYKDQTGLLTLYLFIDDTTYDVTLYEASTGEELAQTVIEAVNTTEYCPQTHRFGPDSIMEHLDASPAEQLEEFLRPYVEP